MTTDLLVAIAGAVVAFIFGYVPWIKDWFEALDPRWKPLVNAGVLLAVALALVGLSCANVVTYFTCDLGGVLKAVELWIAALFGNLLGYQYGVRQFKKA